MQQFPFARMLNGCIIQPAPDDYRPDDCRPNGLGKHLPSAPMRLGANSKDADRRKTASSKKIGIIIV
jgi:hypothetical protein